MSKLLAVVAMQGLRGRYKMIFEIEKPDPAENRNPAFSAAWPAQAVNLLHTLHREFFL